MAVDCNLRGPKPVGFYQSDAHRLDWRRIGKANHWEVFYGNKHVGEFFMGWSGWIGVVFGVKTFLYRNTSPNSLGTAMLMFAGTLFRRNH